LAAFGRPRPPRLTKAGRLPNDPPSDVGQEYEFVASKAIGAFQDPDHLDVVLNGVTKTLARRRIEFSQYREFFRLRRPGADILEADCIEHTEGVGKSRGGGALDGLAERLLVNEASKTIQINEVANSSVTEGSAGARIGFRRRNAPILR